MQHVMHVKLIVTMHELSRQQTAQARSSVRAHRTCTIHKQINKRMHSIPMPVRDDMRAHISIAASM